MKQQTRILVITAVVMSAAGLATGAALAANDVPTTVVATDGAALSMMNGDMGSMMAAGSGSMAGSMRSGDDMDAMHQMMHSMMDGRMPADALAACDKAHEAMVGTTGTEPAGSTDNTIDHASHHRG